MNKFIRKDNYLTRYSHMCGYLDSATVNGDPMGVTLGADGACYHVKARYPSEWETFNNRADAVKCFSKLIRERNGKRNPNRIKP